MRGQDLNLRPSGYEPDELPDCSTPRQRVRSRHWQRTDAPGDGLAWQRPALPRLKTQYHRRCGLSLPSSGWDRVFHPRHNRQANASSGCVLTFPDCCVFAGDARPVCGRGSGAVRAIRTGPLRTLLRFHSRPMDVVVFHDSHARPRFEGSFPLRCFQRLSLPTVATRLCRWRDNRSTRGSSTPVLSY